MNLFFFALWALLLDTASQYAAVSGFLVGNPLATTVASPAASFASPAVVVRPGKHHKRLAVSTPPSLRRQRRSAGSVQLMGLFGLGVPEIVIILVAAAFVLGPQKLTELGKDAGKIASELKEVPKEFQKGLEEGEVEARSRVAKPMKKGDKEKEEEKS